MRTYKEVFIHLLSYSLLLLLSPGCDTGFSDNEIKGILTVDKAQYGNAMLEVRDIDSKLTRFIRPGRKIIKIEQSRKNFDLIILESGNVKLARLHIPLKNVNIKDNSFDVTGRIIDQAWDLKGERQAHILQVEYVPRTGFQNCLINGKPGLTGGLWEVTDARYDYTIDFVNEVTKKNIGHFVAIGEVRTAYHAENSKQCLTPITIVKTLPELFE